MGFLDNVFGGDDKSKKKKNENNHNPLASALQNFNNKTKSFQGQGQSLGGSKPGEVIPITLPNPGPLGVRVEKKSNTSASAIVNEVVLGGQAEAAGLQRGDILCFAGSNGQEEIMYDMFLEIAKSNQRPIQLEARRLKPGSAAGTTASATTGNANFKSADAEARRQAMIAAAEARDKAHKSKTKPTKHVTKSTMDREKQQQKEASEQQQTQEPLSDASRQAAAAVKQDEAALAAQLGYNPYETSKSTAGQARNATTTVQHGCINAPSAGDQHSLKDGKSIPAVAPPNQQLRKRIGLHSPTMQRKHWSQFCLATIRLPYPFCEN
jgi:hypothetical protein